MQCCGEPFAIGSVVRWTLVPPDPDWFRSLLGDIEVDASEEHHGLVEEGRVVTAGTVRSIYAVYVKRAPLPEGQPRVLFPVTGTAQLRSRSSATGWEDEEDRADDLTFEGYLVDLEVD